MTMYIPIEKENYLSTASKRYAKPDYITIDSDSAGIRCG